MIVNRRTFIPKRGCYDQLVELYKTMRDHYGGKGRILVPEFGPFDVLVIEIEYPNMEEYNKFWADIGQDAEFASFFEKHMALTENGGTNEIWTVY